MNKTDTTRILELLTRINASINGSGAERPPTDTRPSLSDRIDQIDAKIGDKVDSLSDRVGTVSDKVDTVSGKVDALDGRVSEVQLGLATLAASTAAQFGKVDGQFATIDKQFGRIDARFEKVDVQFARVDARFDKVDAQFARVDARFNRVDRKIDGLRDELVDHMERVHDELAGRIVDLETPPRGGTGGSVAAS